MEKEKKKEKGKEEEKIITWGEIREGFAKIDMGLLDVDEKRIYTNLDRAIKSRDIDVASKLLNSLKK